MDVDEAPATADNVFVTEHKVTREQRGKALDLDGKMELQRNGGSKVPVLISSGTNTEGSESMMRAG